MMSKDMIINLAMELLKKGLEGELPKGKFKIRTKDGWIIIGVKLDADQPKPCNDDNRDKGIGED